MYTNGTEKKTSYPLAILSLLSQKEMLPIYEKKEGQILRGEARYILLK